MVEYIIADDHEHPERYYDLSEKFTSIADARKAVAIRRYRNSYIFRCSQYDDYETPQVFKEVY